MRKNVVAANPGPGFGEGADSTVFAADSLSRVRVVLCRPRHPGNMGAVARAMKTMGLTRLVLVAPERPIDDEARVRATGAIDVLEQAKHVGTLREALAGTVGAAALTARLRDLGPPVHDARTGAAGLAGLLRDHPGREVALVFGNETSGLSNDEVMCCDRALTIPTNPDFSSLNLGAAAQVLAYELRLAVAGAALPTTIVTPSASPRATHDEVEGMLQHLEQAMLVSGFHRADQPKRLMPKLRRLFARTALERDEVNILRGILAALLQPWAARREGDAGHAPTVK